MFSSKFVPCLLHTFSGFGDDTDHKELRLVFHVIPITHDLAREVSEHLADRLFRIEPDGVPFMRAVREMSKAMFSGIVVPMQNVEFHALPDGEDPDPMLVEGVSISNLRAARASADSSEFRLEFDAQIPMNDLTMRLVQKYYKASVFVNMIEVQRALDFQQTPEQAAESQSINDAANGKPSGGRRGRKRGAPADNSDDQE